MGKEGESHVEEWHGFDIEGRSYKKQFNVEYHCVVSREGQKVFGFVGEATIGDKGFLEDEYLRETPDEELGLKRVRAMIDLRSFEQGLTERRPLHQWPKSDIPQRELRRRLLEVFEGIRQVLPKSYKAKGVDIEGLCMELGITENEYLSAVDYLLGKGHLKRWDVMPDDYNYRQLHITADGIDALEQGLLVGPVVEELVADTREFVDSNLERLSPKAAQKLAETYDDLVKGETELKWSQVAYACRDILQDFTDAICDPQFLGVEIQVPPTPKIKNKVRAALEARIPTVGRTERRLLEALAQYINDYFDKLNAFIQKHVHPSKQEQVRAEAAKRCVIYTYLLIADVLSLLL